MTNLLRTTPAAAVTFTSFEVINRRIRQWAESDDVERSRVVQPQVVVKQPVKGDKATAAAGGEGSDDEQTAVVLSPPFATATGAIYDPKKLESHLKALGGDAE